MRRALPTWIVLAACVVLACGALAWLSVTTLRLERAEARARAEAQAEERVRLALWRMDGRLARLLAQESTRVVSAWQSFYAPLHSFSLQGNWPEPSMVRLASPLLYGTPDGVRLHFAFQDSGLLRSPQVPVAEQRALALAAGARSEQIEQAEALLAELDARLDRRVLLGLETGASSPELIAVRQQNATDYALRQMQAFGNAAYGEFPSEASAGTAPATQEVQVSPMVPVWMGKELLLVRRVDRGGGAVEVQGAWLDWARLRALLLAEVTDLLPGAELEPVAPGSGDLLERRLASLPVRLLPGAVPVALTSGSPVIWSLVVAWGALVLALAAVGLLLFGAISLSERRAAFVSAVTHELRTPLTTFRMYAEMLAEGMVTEESQRQGYYETLQRESNRLAHLVENVLAYARLERKREPRPAEPLELGALLRDNLGRSEERAREAGMSLVLELTETLEGARVLVEPSGAEQVLFNLVDNACKYARGAEDTRIHVRAERRGSRLAIVVADHGPGISATDSRNLFEPFSKSSERAAESAPGVGLGLALSRRLARAMGAELRYEGQPGKGAAFALLLRAG